MFLFSEYDYYAWILPFGDPRLTFYGPHNEKKLKETGGYPLVRLWTYSLQDDLSLSRLQNQSSLVLIFAIEPSHLKYSTLRLTEVTVFFLFLSRSALGSKKIVGLILQPRNNLSASNMIHQVDAIFFKDFLISLKYLAYTNINSNISRINWQ